MRNTSRRSASSAYHRFYRHVKGIACIYCGLRATTKDHFVPLSVVVMLGRCGEIVVGKFLLPSCGECNGIASDKIFPTVAAKRRHIHEKLRKKHKRILEIPIWNDYEKEELGWTLRTSVEAGLAQKNVLQQRLAWRNTSVSTHVDIAAIRFGLLARGQNIVQRSAE